MAGTRTTASGNATYTFAWTKTTAIIDEIADNAAHKIWRNSHPDELDANYTTLTVQQKINIIDVFLAKQITALAGNYKKDVDVAATISTDDTYINANYGL